MATKKDTPLYSLHLLESMAQCPKKAWLEVHKPELATPAEDAGYWRMQAEAVRKAAQRQFKGAFSIVDGVPDAFDSTRAVMRRHPGGSFFYPAFTSVGMYARPDALEQKSKGVVLSVISASTAKGQALAKDKHTRLANRLAADRWLLSQKKIKTISAAVHVLERERTWDGKDPTYEGLLTRVDLSEDSRELATEVRIKVEDLKALLAKKKAPKVAVTRHCKKPFPCAFIEHCKAEKGRPEASVYDIPGRYWSTQDNWHDAGYYDLAKVPKSAIPFELQPIVSAILSKKVWHRKGLKHLLADLPYPRYYFDFEAISLALPAWEGRRPYEQIPFQWSVHIESAPGVWAHKSFLDVSGADPALACAKSLVRALGKSGPVLAYHSAYESARLREMAEQFPKLAGALLMIDSRLVDLEPLVRDNYYHPSMGGSYSLKKVLAALAPELAYETLDEVRNGVDAQMAYLSLVGGGWDKERFSHTRARLLSYCEHDTWGLVVVLHKLARKPLPMRPAIDKRPAGTNTFNQAKIKKAWAPAVWSLWEQQLPNAEAEVHWKPQVVAASQ